MWSVFGREFVVVSNKDDAVQQSCSSGEELRHPQPCHWPFSPLWSVCAGESGFPLSLHCTCTSPNFRLQENRQPSEKYFEVYPDQNEQLVLLNTCRHTPSAFSEWKLISAPRQSNQSPLPCKVFLDIYPLCMTCMPVVFNLFCSFEKWVSLTSYLAGVKQGENVCRLEQPHSPTAGISFSQILSQGIQTWILGSWTGYTVSPRKASSRRWKTGDTLLSQHFIPSI